MKNVIVSLHFEKWNDVLKIIDVKKYESETCYVESWALTSLAELCSGAIFRINEAESMIEFSLEEILSCFHTSTSEVYANLGGNDTNRKDIVKFLVEKLGYNVLAVV